VALTWATLTTEVLSSKTLTRIVPLVAGVAVGSGVGEASGVAVAVGVGVGVGSGVAVGVGVGVALGSGDALGSVSGEGLVLTAGEGESSGPLGVAVLLGLQALNSDRVHRVARVTGKRSLADIMLCIMRASYGLYF